MSKKSTSQLPDLDDKLAELADQVIGGQLPLTTDLNDEDEEVRSLTQMMIRLDEELRSDQPKPDMARRIRASLIAEWKRSGLGAEPAVSKEHWWSKLARVFMPAFKQQQAFAMALAVVVVIVLVALAVSPLSSGTVLPGTAESNGDIFPAVLLLGLIVLGVLVWLARRRR